MSIRGGEKSAAQRGGDVQFADQRMVDAAVHHNAQKESEQQRSEERLVDAVHHHAQEEETFTLTIRDRTKRRFTMSRQEESEKQRSGGDQAAARGEKEIFTFMPIRGGRADTGH